MPIQNSERTRVTSKLGAESAASWAWLALIALMVAILGGSSRPDAIQIAALRPMAALFLLPALYFLNFEQLKRAKMLVLLFTLLMLWMIFQLVPLPPAMWQSLPGREALVELGRLAEFDQAWRPISWVPARGWNALASLVVPIVALLLALAMRANAWMLLLIIVGIGLLDSVLGLFQVISGRTSPLYFYAVTNRGLPVGIFANENHSAVLSALVLLVVAKLAATCKSAKEPAWLRLTYPPTFVVVLLSALVSASRAGLVMSVLALIAASFIAWASLTASRRRNKQGKLERWITSHPRSLLLAFLGVIGVLIASFIGLERAPGFEDIFSQNAFEDLRWRLWPLLEQMIGTHWLFGIGFGSFEEFYHIHEPNALLYASYLNQAHNDWAQFVIEGGLPAIALLAMLLGWIATSIGALLIRSQMPLRDLVFWGAIFAIFSATSIIDYPLRTGILQLVGTWLLLAIVLERSEQPRPKELKQATK